ncbi:hypothetical protein KS4_07050 [Poriferisphaera corsica]|uniref:Uncharacterized protein n=1 Tax=Poriferisphaera corsica TaxID=2528020 RepID=A0A517YR58_9BACT|nr:hypothetical protein [Poriferisphaera corsica]QDU32671.1 hypothetical protein KS4_07050 [Poriferisphaera corsica]
MGKLAVRKSMGKDKGRRHRRSGNEGRNRGGMGVVWKLKMAVRLVVYGLAVYLPVMGVWLWYTGYGAKELLNAGGMWMTPMTSFLMTPMTVMREDGVVGEIGMMWGVIAVGLLVLMGLHLLSRLLGGWRGMKWESLMLLLVGSYSVVCSCYWLEVLARV